MNMKIIKNIIKTVLFSTFITIAANAVHLVPASKIYAPIEQECKALKSHVKKNNTVKITKDNAQTLFQFIEHVTKNFIPKTHLSMPDIYLYLGDDQNSYNASLLKQTYAYIVPQVSRTRRISTKIMSTQYQLIVGAELVKLFTWDRDLIPCFEAVIAHEIGHAVNNHAYQKNQLEAYQNEYDADKFAISILDSPHNLSKAIDMLTLSGHIYNNLMAIAGQETHEEVLYLVRVLTSALIEEVPELNKLGMSASHSEFASLVYAALNPVLNQVSTQGQTISASQFVINSYNNLKTVCLTPEKMVGQGNNFQIANKLLDELTNRYFSPISHPTPKNRKIHIKQCIEAIKNN